MVAGFAEDIDSEDESAIPVVTNHVNEDLSSRELARASKKPPAAVTVESSSSEEEEKEDESDEEEKRKERERRERENERTKAKKDREMKNESAKLKLEMPVNSSSGMEPVVDGFGLGTEDVDDWLNSPDSDPKVRMRFFGRIRKRICDPRSYGFFDTKETQNPKKDYFVMTRQAGGTQYINQNDTFLVLP